MLYYSITPIDISSRKSFYFLPMSFSFRPGSEDNKQNYADVPVGYRLSYWCIGYIEKIGGGHHRHYEFFIWMLRRLNYRAVWATLLTASYMDSSIAATATNQPSIRTSARFLLNRILDSRMLIIPIQYIGGQAWSLIFRPIIDICIYQSNP